MKIALVAMSGVRCCDEELLDLGLTLPGFVERGKTIAALPSLGLLTLAGMTPSHHEVDYLEIPELADAEDLPECDLVAISSYSAQISEAYALARNCRGRGIPVVIGGPHVTAAPDEALEFCDAVAIGEGELCWEEILDDCEKGRLAGRYGLRNSAFDLGRSPVPAFELLDISQYNRLTVQASRGCPHQCEFCASSVILTEKYKQKSVAQVLAEIDKILDIWERPFIEFADDNAFVNKRYWKELLGHLSDKKIKWFAETDLSVCEDVELLELMRRSGCAQVLIGLESPIEAGLSGLEMRNNWKLKRFAQYKEAVQRIQAHGITVNGCFVLGLDGHTPEIFEQTFAFVKEAGFYEVQITIMTPFPGTPLYSRLVDEQRMLFPAQWERCTLFDVNFKPKNMTVAELADGFKELAGKLYDDDFTRWRRENFRQFFRSSSVAQRRLS